MLYNLGPGAFFQLFLACCGFYLLANANLAYEELKPWLKNECPVIYISEYLVIRSYYNHLPDMQISDS